MERVVRETVVDAPVGVVWEAVTDPEQLGDWFGALLETRERRTAALSEGAGLGPGDIVLFRFHDGSTRRALVESIEPQRRLVFRWLPTPKQPGSRVEIDCEPKDVFTRVRVVETRLESAVDPEPSIGFRVLART